MKFNIKGKSKEVWQETQPILFGTAGIIATQKFLDFKTLFPNMDPTKPLIKHEGLIKVGAGVLLLTMFGKKMNPMLKFAIVGMAIQGGVKAVRTYTTNKETGKAFVDQIGAAEFDEQIKSLAAQVKNATNEFGTSVGAANPYLEKNPAVALNNNAATTVGSMGMGLGDDMFNN